MKIAIDIRSLLEKEYSGVSEYTLNLLKALFGLDQNNQYILFYNSFKKANIPVLDYPNVKICSFAYPNKFFNLSLRFLKFPKIDKLIGEVDVFFIPNLQFVSLTKKTKQIVTIHDLSFERYPNFFTVKQRLWHKLVNAKNLCETSKKIIAVSQNTKNEIVKLFGIDESKVKVIASGVSNDYHQVQSKDKLNKVKEKYNLPDNFILYLGNIEPRKNISSLLSAFKKIGISDTELVIAGKGKINKQKNKIKFIGYVDRQDKPALYTLAKIFVYPSFYEGFGFPPLEAMACGTPVVCSHASSLPEIVESAAITVDTYNELEIKEAVEKLIRDNDLRKNLKQKGFGQVNKFKWQNTAAQLLDIFQSI